MEGISHDNRFFIFRVPFFIFLFPVLIFKYFNCRKLSKKYVAQEVELSKRLRYERIMSLFKRSVSFKNLSYSFLFKEKMPQNQVVFVVNESFDWYTLGLIRKLVKSKQDFYPTIFFNNIPCRRFYANLWALIDPFYDIEEGIASKQSFLIEKDFLDKFPKVLDLMKCNHIIIVPVYKFYSFGNIKYLIGESFKTGNLINFKNEALSSLLDESFEKLKDSLSLFESKKAWMQIRFRDLFSIK